MRRKSSKLSRASTRSAAKSLLKELPSILKLLFRLMVDRRVPVKDKALFALVAAYVISPLDLIPDFFGGFLGMVDDLYLVGMSLGRLLASAGEEVLLEHWDGDPRSLGFLIESVESLGGLLPTPVRNALHTTAVTGEAPVRMKRRSRSGVDHTDEFTLEDDEPRIHRVRHAKMVKRKRPKPVELDDDEIDFDDE